MKKLTVKDIQIDIPFNVGKPQVFRNVKNLSKIRTKIDFDVYLPEFGCNLQREFCWTVLQKHELIMSVLQRRYIPPLSILYHEPDNIDTFQVIDGKQRLSTLIEFYLGYFPLQIAGRDYFYDDLDDILQSRISLFMPNAVMAYSDDDHGYKFTDEDKVNWFRLINFAGTEQDREHLSQFTK